MTGAKEHWDTVHESKRPEEVSWWQATPSPSLQLIEACALGRDDPIIDVGGGASTLVDHALSAGYRNFTVLDIASGALEHVRERLGARCGDVRLVEADVTQWSPGEQFALWHDRAVFHFLTSPHDRAAYGSTLSSALRPRGHAIVATFGLDGPARCSGLDVMRYSPDTLSAELGDAFDLVESVDEMHATPWGAEQAFVFCRFRRTDP